MVKINYCPACGSEVEGNSLICPNCHRNIDELYSQKDSEMELIDPTENNEIVIEVPGDSDEIIIPLDEIIDLDKLGDEEINIVVQVDPDSPVVNLIEDEDDFEDVCYPMEFYDEDDPYEIVYYEYVDEDSDSEFIELDLDDDD